MIARHLETVLTQKLFQSKAIIIMGQGKLEKQRLPCNLLKMKKGILIGILQSIGK